MPIYVFHDKETDVVWEEMMSIAKMEQFLSDYPMVHTIPQAAAIVSGVSVKDKTADGWKETLQRAAEKSPGTPLSDRYGRTDDAKAVKTREIVKKHMGDGKATPGY